SATCAPARSVDAVRENAAPPGPARRRSNSTRASPPGATDGTEPPGRTARSRVEASESAPSAPVSAHEVVPVSEPSTGAEPSSATSVSSRQPPTTRYLNGPANG